MESLGSRFAIYEVRITFKNASLNESFGENDSTPPHRLLAMYLANRKISPYRLANKFDYDDKSTNKNPFNNVPCEGVSYYFKSTFNANGNKVRGIIRISDHPASPAYFAEHGYDYGLSIVFDNKNVRVGKRSSVGATVYEYIKDSKLVNSSDVYDTARKFLEAGGLIKIENDEVVQPSNIDFKKITKFSDKQASKEYSLVTFDDITGGFANFISLQDKNLQVMAKIDSKTNCHLSEEDLNKFQFGDVIKFYYIDNGQSVLLGRPLTVNK